MSIGVRRVFIITISLSLFFSIITGCNSIEKENTNSTLDYDKPGADLKDTVNATSTDIGIKDTETYILNLFKSSQTNNEDTSKILLSLKNINWSKYDEVSNGKTPELLGWLYKQNIQNENEIISVIYATAGLDGYMADAYCGIIAKIFLGDKGKFIKCLSNLESEKVKIICSYLIYGTGNSSSEKGKQIVNDLEIIRTSSNYSDKEKEVANELIKSYDSGVIK